MSENKDQRIQQINQMLLEMASGNFFYRLERSAKNGTIDALAVTLNMLAEEILETIQHQGYVNTNKTVLHVIQMSFILDKNGLVQMVNQRACAILSFAADDIIGKPFDTFLTEPSRIKWSKTWKGLQQRPLYDTALDLTFKTKDNLIIPNPCYITTFKDKATRQQKTLITIIHHSDERFELEKDIKQQVMEFEKEQQSRTNDKQIEPQKRKIRLSFEDIRKLREGHDAIINNLEKDLPSLKDFALQLGTNEFKLKYGFKELYGTTVHRFLMQERLRKSKMLIQYTEMSLKSIANTTGFKSIPHFSRTFKKRYGYVPSALRKKGQMKRDK